MPVSAPALSIEELHGPYGPYQVSELVLQRVWMELAFDVSKLVDHRGRSVEVEFVGRWNRLQGPDFKDAVLLIDGQRMEGDVEVHFSQTDWKNHGHDGDPSYNSVILHVVYHRPTDVERPARKQNGDEIACVALLPILWYSLEEYASDDSIIASTGVDLRPEVERLLQLDLPERRHQLVEQARKRWELKQRFARLRIARLGWEDACHQSALEIMGYAKNRLPMLRVAQRFPFEIARSQHCRVEDLWEAGGDGWRLNGTRPANHPKLRLEQYIDWARARPDWPQLLRDLATAGSAFAEAASLHANETSVFGTQSARSKMGIAALRRKLAADVLGRTITGSKMDTLVCDGFLALLAADENLDLFDLWFHWPPGNGPASCVHALKQLQILEPRRVPMSNGWLQGMLGVRI